MQKTGWRRCLPPVRWGSIPGCLIPQLGEVEAIPKVLEEQPSIKTFGGVPQRISMNVLIGYLRNLGKRLGFDDRCKVITYDGKKVSKDHVATIYGRLESIGLAISKEKAKDAVEMVATENRCARNRTSRLLGRKPVETGS